MAWNHTETTVTVPKVWTIEELLKTEKHWVSSYNEIERWIKDFKVAHYSLIGEYEVDKTHKLYRFELDETHRKDLAVLTSHFQNVLIDVGLSPVKIGNDFTDSKLPVVEVKVDVCEACKRPFDKDKK